MSQGGMDRLEVGGNVFELIEFTLDRHLSDGKVKCGHYGVNVAKVREVVRMPAVNPLASSIHGVAGVFELRGVPIPAINLAAALGDKIAPVNEEQQIIVTEFSQKRAGFIVKSTHRIRRIAWEKVLPPTADKHTCINGMTLIENNEFLFILDLEKVLVDIEIRGGQTPHYFFPSSPASNQACSGLASSLGQGRSETSAPPEAKLLLVDDSDIILSNAKNFLEKHRYHVYTATDGQQAQKLLLSSLSQNDFTIDAIITDVEMPRMDGLSLTKWVKQHPVLRSIPVILHTSLSGQTNHAAGKTVGADGYVVKNDLKSLLSLLSHYKNKS